MHLPRLEKWSVLAGLRFLLASLVAFNHMPIFIPIGAWSIVPQFGAFEAILGFLLISGYSIGASCIKEPDGFLIRRVKRIYPVYLASIALAYAVFVMEHASRPPTWEVLVNVLFLNQIVTSTSFVGPAWSLALEFWLYCLTPLLLTLKESTLKTFVYVSFASFVVHTCGRTLFHWDYYSGVGYGLNLLLLSFIWLAGLRLAKNAHDPKPILWQVGLMFAAHISLSAAIQLASRWKHGNVPAFFQGDIIGFGLQAFTLGVVLWAFVRLLTGEAKKKAPPSAFLRMLGDISYPLYLIHIPVYFLLNQTGLRSPVLFYLGAVVASFAVYWVLDQYSQRRHLRPSAPGNAKALPGTVPRGES